MTNEQAQWLRLNELFEPVGRLGGTAHYVHCGVLHADGTFVRGHTSAVAPPHPNSNNPFIVGQMKLRHPGHG